MRSAFFPKAENWLHERLGNRLRGRAATFILVVLLHILLLIIFILLSPPLLPKLPEVKIFELLPPSLTPAPKPAPKPAAKAKMKATTKTTKPATTPIAPKTITAPKPVLFDKLLVQGFDLSKLPKTTIATASTADAEGADSGDSKGVGEGPGGVKLYNAEWQREPTHAELAYYLKHGAPQGSWALIACRTVPRNQVEDCVQLGESPSGSGLARAMINAAWQFRVKPPRVNSQAQVGAWVRIRFDFSQKPGGGEDDSGDRPPEGNLPSLPERKPLKQGDYGPPS